MKDAQQPRTAFPKLTITSCAANVEGVPVSHAMLFGIQKCPAPKQALYVPRKVHGMKKRLHQGDSLRLILKLVRTAELRAESQGAAIT